MRRDLKVPLHQVEMTPPIWKIHTRGGENISGDLTLVVIIKGKSTAETRGRESCCSKEKSPKGGGQRHDGHSIRKDVPTQKKKTWGPVKLFSFNGEFSGGGQMCTNVRFLLPGF